VEVFLARQPILDGSQLLYGYELLFRGSPENLFPDLDGDYATSRVIHNATLVFSGDTLAVGKKVFVNFTRRMLLSELFSILPSHQTVIELLEGIEPDQEVIDGCKALKTSGYMLALDDFLASPGYEPLIELADFLKVDFLTTSPEERRELAERYRNDLLLVAEKVETFEQVREGFALGYHYFQGFFFCEPEMLSRREIPAVKLGYLKFLKEIVRPDLDLDQLEQVIKREVSLSVKLLRFLRSAAFGYGDRVRSIRQALTLLGERPLKKWASMISLLQIAEDKPSELLVTCLVRARFCELLAPEAGLGRHRHESFLVGMLSLIDVFVGRPITELVRELGVSDEIEAGLLEKESSLGRVRSLVVAHERGNWDQVDSLEKDLGVSESAIPDLYAQAVLWAQEVLQL
jgi:EAL and modified HD-GYP domain-containing signal transduction protein